MLQPKTRVQLVKAVDNFPTGFFDIGLTGTLREIDEEGSYWVTLDKHFPELDEWQNAIQIWDWSAQDGPDCHPETYLEAIA